MELLRGNLYVYWESQNYSGKWILAEVVVNSNGIVELLPQGEVKRNYCLSSHWAVQAPSDSVWHKPPPLPFQRSVRETISLCEKKEKPIWLLALSEHDRNKWYTTLAPFTQRRPPPYGDYDNWSYPQDESDYQPTCPTPFHTPRSLVPQHRSGFYSVHGSQKKSPKLTDVSPVTATEPTPLPLKSDQAKGICCRCCTGILTCICSVFSVCLQQCCLNCSAVIN